MQKFVSIIIPFYSYSQKLINCIASIENEVSDIKKEIFLIHDNLSSSANIKYKNKIDEITNNSKNHYFFIDNGKNLGPSFSRNVALKKAKGDYIFFTNDDTVLDKYIIKNHINTIVNDKIISVGKILHKYSDTNKTLQKIVNKSGFGEKTSYFSNNNPNNFCTANLMLKRDFIDNNILFDENIKVACYEDVELGLRLVNQKYQIKYTPNAFVEHFHDYNDYSIKKRIFHSSSSLNYIEKKYNNKSGLLETNFFKLLIFFILKSKLFANFDFLHNYAKYGYLKQKLFFGLKRKNSYFRKIFDILVLRKKNKKSFNFFITSKCQESCSFCFYDDYLNKTEDLSLEEIKETFKNMGDLSHVIFSGGEPFLRKDLFDIVEYLVINNNLEALTIPSNGLMKERIANVLENLLFAFPNLRLMISFSIDANEGVYDNLRGVPGAYNKIVDTIKYVDLSLSKYKNFTLNLNSVVLPNNINNFEKLFIQINDLNLSGYDHSFEIERPKRISEGYNTNFERNNIYETYSKILNYKISNFEKKLSGNKFLNTILISLYYANIKLLYKTQLEFLFDKKKWAKPCIAGDDIYVIRNNGDLSICELKDKFTNIKDHLNKKFDIKKIFKSRKSESIDCYCTHLCWILPTLYDSKKAKFFIYPKFFIEYFIKKIFFLKKVIKI
tara:strand:+ start:771 stop:2771 length:2001 start_codon:yes stop_codon:yes gene_type:complete